MLLFAFLVFVTGIASSLGDYDGSAFPLGEGPHVVPSKTDLKAERAFRAQLAAVPGKPRIPHTVQALEYNVTIHPYFPAPGVSYPGEKNFTFDGHLRFHFKALQRLDFIQLDAQNIDLDYINIFDSNGAKMRVTYVTYHAKFMRFSVAPLVGFDANQEYVVEMIYRGKINHYRNAGLFYTSFIDANKTLHYIVATHMESGYGAKSVFPCIDDPSFKAHFLLTLNYPAHPSFVPLANTLEHEGSILGKGYKKVEFPRTLLMSTYLVAFATGEFVAKSSRTPDGILVRSWAWIGMEDYLEFAANTSAQCLYRMSQYVNFTFPMDKTDQLGLPEFPAGAMENYGLIIYKYQYIAYNPKVHTTFNKFSAIRVMCHELSHQWFGDTVTAMWWDDLFLHEGFAGYYEYYLPEMTFPSQSPFLSSDFVAANEETGLLADADLRYSHPVIYKDGPAFDDMTYNKGGSVLRMLRQVIGDTAFQNGLQSYIAKYKFQNANHSMLFNELTSAAADQGILDWCNRLIDVNHFMDPWMLQQNFPLISVTHNGDYETLTQASFSDPSKLPPSPYNYSWPVPVFYQGDPQVKHLQLAWIIPSYENNCPDPAIEPKYRAGKFQLNNADSWTFARVKYDDDSFQAILKALKSDNSISVASKVRLLNDAKTFAMQESKLGNSDAYIRVLDLINAILPSSDPHLAIFATVQEFIDLLEGLMNSNNQRALYGQFVKATIGPLCNQVGWNTSNSWDLNIARERILPYCVRYNLPGFVKTAMSLYNDLLGACSKFRNGTESCNPLHPDIRKAVYCAAAMQNNQNIFTQLISFYVAQYQNDIYFYQAYQALLHGLSCAPNEMNLTAVVHHIVNSPLVGSTELFYMATNPLVFQTFRDYIQNPDNFNKIVQRGLLRGYLNAMTFNVFDSIRSGQLVDLSNKYLNVMNGDQRKIFYEFVLKTNEQVRFSKKHEKSIERWMWNNVVIIAPAFPPWPKRLPANAAYPTAYSIKIKPYLPGSPGMKPDQNLTFEATSTMNFVMLQTTNELTINAHRMIFSEITLQDFDTGSLLPVDLSKIVYDFDNAIITLVLPIVLKPNVDQLIIFKYTGFIFGKPHGGISVNTFVNTLDHDKLSWIFFTDYEGGPEFRSMAPSFDEPNYKATWQITIVHPKDTVALSNMPAKSSLMPLPSESLWTETQFEKTKKMSTYLVEMIVGHFASIQAVSKSGVTVRVFAWPGMEVKGEYALRAAIGTLDFMGTYFESNFPLPKLDVIALPQYIPGADAMENWGLITNEFDMVLFDKDYGTVEQLISVLQVTSHEVVHQWFGDLVTLEWWDYVFLNEGFAEYWWMQCLISTFPEQADVFKFIRFDNHQSA
ncbi:hypothetical protein L596_022435 [Steinernema carpocapsae]|uniref:Aminopeptidase n=1 Tax=Steinernema carpocapsae TaxID=34508 RepID=A0A4U5MM35_STECR|nr:hypothetical protein L596_022435 [Steinernema carpocapsae]